MRKKLPEGTFHIYHAGYQQQWLVERTYRQGRVTESSVDNDHTKETDKDVEPDSPESCKRETLESMQTRHSTSMCEQ